MIRVVLDTNIVVSALLVPSGKQATILSLAIQGQIGLSISLSVLAEYEEVLHRPRLRLETPHIEASLAAIRSAAQFVEPAQVLSVSVDDSDNRFLECAEAAEADYLVTGNTRHFPQISRMPSPFTSPSAGGGPISLKT
jgi:putative PIN family toxin of toxin-antitoxin system